ncbi:MAG: ribonuclease HIII [Bradymonadia bacterium]
MSSSYTIKIDPNEQAIIRAFFHRHDFEFDDVAHAFWRALGPDVRATFYRSGKLLLQGKEASTWRGLLSDVSSSATPYAAALARHPKPNPDVWGGTDEAGKGDYFGPLVVAGVAVKRSDLPLLFELGIDDSKALSDERIKQMDGSIRQLCEHQVLMIGPEKYNQLYSKIGNLNRLLAWAHAKVIENLIDDAVSRPEWFLIDRFANEGTMNRALSRIKPSLNYDQWPKAESDPAVAAASVLARAAFLRGVGALSRRFDIKLPLGGGAATLSAGRQLLDRHGQSALGQVAKLHFANTGKIGASL